MTIGDQRAFPHEYKELGNIRVVQEGMTYRQWLVGQIAGDILKVAIGYNVSEAYNTECAKAAIEYADAIIKRLEEK